MGFAQHFTIARQEISIQEITRVCLVQRTALIALLSQEFAKNAIWDICSSIMFVSLQECYKTHLLVQKTAYSVTKLMAFVFNVLKTLCVAS
jgi:hypothetical protein